MGKLNQYGDLESRERFFKPPRFWTLKSSDLGVSFLCEINLVTGYIPSLIKINRKTTEVGSTAFVWTFKQQDRVERVGSMVSSKSLGSGLCEGSTEKPSGVTAWKVSPPLRQSFT